MNEPAFVAGATGYTGREVVRSLVERGIDTVAHVRPDSPRRDAWTRRFEHFGARVDSTAWEPSALCATLEGCRPGLVFALLGTTARRARAAAREGADASYEAVDFALSSMLLDCTPEPARFVYLSAIGVRPTSRNPYLAARWRMEMQLRASGRDWIIARPAFITGPDRDESRPAERIAAFLVDGALAVASRFGARRLRARYASISATELARGLVRHALDPRSAGRVLYAEDLRAEPPATAPPTPSTPPRPGPP